MPTSRGGRTVTASSLRTRATRLAPLVSVLLTVVSTAAMVGLTNRADERFHPYVFGPEFLAAPWQVVVEAFEISFVNAAEFGNFRPLGRVVEHLNYLLGEIIGQLTGAPAHITLGMLRMASAVGLAWLLVAVARRLVGDRGSLVTLAVAGAFPGLLVAYGYGSAMVIFSAMYLQTAALVLLAVLLFSRDQLYEPGRATHGLRLAGHALLGAGVAVFNELAWIAVPAVGATVVALLVAHRTGWRGALRTPVVARGAMALTGFLALAVPVRLFLARACADATTSCYANSNPDPAGLDPVLLANRVIAGLPLASWASGPFFTRLPWVLGIAVVAGVGVLAVLWWPRVRGTPSRRGGDRAEVAAASGDRAIGGDRAPRPRWLVVVTVGATLVLTGALLSGLSEALQGADNPWQGFREAPVAFAGWALVLGGIAGVVADRLRTQMGLGALVVVAALGVGGAVVGTGFQHDRDALDPRLALTEDVGVEVASFDLTAAGDERRCELVRRFEELHPGRPAQHRRFENAVETVSEDRHGLPFCSQEAS